MCGFDFELSFVKTFMVSLDMSVYSNSYIEHIEFM